ncbi:hypothetical protein [Cupriavidus sp. PET2-C1]
MPLMISDILLSRPGFLDKSVLAIPSVRTSREVYGEYPNELAALTQKLTVINDRAIFSFAGSYDVGCRVESELRNSLSEGRSAEEAWSYSYKNLSYRERQENSFLFDGIDLISNNQAERLPASHGTISRKKMREFKNLEIAGTGKGHAEEIFSRLDSPPIGVEQIGKYEKAVQKALAIVAELIDLDIRSKTSFDELFGGFYEIAMWYGNRYIKLDGVQYVYWTLVANEDVVRFRMDRIYLQHYNEGVLCVDEVLIREDVPDLVSMDGTAKLPISKFLHHRVAGLAEGYDACDFKVIDESNFSHRLTVHTIRFDLGGQISLATTVDGCIRSPHHNPDIVVNEKAVEIRDGFLSEYKDSLVDAMQKAQDEYIERTSSKPHWLHRLSGFFGA